MSIQTKLEEKFKYYLSLKSLVEKESTEVEKTKLKIAEKAEKLSSIEQKASLYFEAIGAVELTKLDLLEAKKELYHYFKAYEDLVEVPKEIEKELDGYKVNVVFAVVNGKKEIVNKELYESYKKQHLDYTFEVEKYLESQIK